MKIFKLSIILFVILMIITGCGAYNEEAISESKATTGSVSKEVVKQGTNGSEKNVVDEKVDIKDTVEQKEVGKIELPNVIDEIIAWEFEPFKEKWGKTQEVQVESGNGYQFKSIPGVTIIPNENGIISSVVINNKNMDVYGSKVGQTPAEVKKVMDDYGIEMLSEGENEMDGGWLVQYQIDGNKTAWYTSDGEDEPINSILLTMSEFEPEQTTSSNEDSNAGSSQSNNYGPASLSAFWSGVEQSGSQEIPVIEVTNEGETTAEQITVRVTVYYSRESGGSSSTTQSGNLILLSPGETREIKVLNAAAYTIDEVEVLEVQGKALQ